MGRTRYEYSFIEIQRPALELPEVSCVTTFGTPRWYDPRRRSRNLELCSYLEITRRLPRVSELHWATAEAGLFFLLRREIRDRFVHTAAAADAHDPCRWLPASVKTMAVTIKAPNWSDHQFDHHRRLPNLSRPYGHDEVSAAFRKMSVGLKKFRFKGIADHALFWPSPSEKHIEEPHWPNLTHLRVDLSYQSPSGKWYFKCQDADDPRNHPWSDVPVSGDALEFRPPGYGTEQDKEEALEYLASWLDHVPSFRYRDGRGVFQPTFRTWPNDKVMIPLLESFARAIGQMPSLRSAALLFDDGDLDSYTFVSYASPGYETTATRNAQLRDQKLFKTVPRLVISSCKWRMSKSLKGLFREVGSKCHNQATVVRYLPVSLDYSDDDDDSD
ncbi:hypothetical protein QBC46DRAFT_378885 [Diplogelasinospora grovesii]|uniref:Uncharacterized protein n=1 Tax=Diplogelasinospora grovesii TaxID=303347 RepID=A0AAN6NCR3_9PEZI|nr:hypothetical protein QBC46DRAFT_378885 [Diplogelasinospora grovesii]